MAGAPITVPLNVSAPVAFASPNPNSQIPLVVQSVADAGGSGLTYSFLKPTTQGNCIVVIINAYNSTSGNVPAVTSVTLNGAAGNFFAAANAVSGYVASLYALSAIWVDYNCAGGQTVIAINGPNLTINGDQIQIFEVSGLPLTNPVDRTSTGASAVSGTSWSSGATAATRFANQIWFGSFQAGFAPTTTPGPPWVNQGSTLDLGGGAYQVAAAKGTATFAGTQTTTGAWAAAVVTLTAGAPILGTAQIGPRNQREVWYPEVISVSASSNASESTCRIYAGPDATPANFVDSTETGSTGFSTYPTTNRTVHCNEYVFAVWTGGDLGAQGRLVIVGTKVINSGGPPDWQHVRKRA